MTTVVLQAHPANDSFNTAVFEAVVGEITRQRQPPTTVRIGHGEPLTAEMFAGAERLVAVYPTWYGSLPAMFLAAMADALGPWIDDGEPIASSPLRTVQSLKVITSHGSSKLINMVQGEPGLQLWKRTILPLCAPSATFGWQALYKLDRNETAEREAFISAAATFAAA